MLAEYFFSNILKIFLLPSRLLRGCRKMMSASNNRSSDPFPLSVSHPPKMIPYFRLYAPPTDIRARHFPTPPPSPRLGWRHFWMAPKRFSLPIADCHPISQHLSFFVEYNMTRSIIRGETWQKKCFMFTVYSASIKITQTMTENSSFRFSNLLNYTGFWRFESILCKIDLTHPLTKCRLNEGRNTQRPPARHTAPRPDSRRPSPTAAAHSPFPHTWFPFRRTPW